MNENNDPDYIYTFRLHTKTRTDYDSSGIQEKDELDEVETGSE